MSAYLSSNTIYIIVHIFFFFLLNKYFQATKGSLIVYLSSPGHKRVHVWLSLQLRQQEGPGLAISPVQATKGSQMFQAFIFVGEGSDIKVGYPV